MASRKAIIIDNFCAFPVLGFDDKFERQPDSPVHDAAKMQMNNVILYLCTNLMNENVTGKPSGRFCLLARLKLKSSEKNVDGWFLDLCMNMKSPTVEQQLMSASDPLCFYFRKMKVLQLNKSEEEMFKSVIDIVENYVYAKVDLVNRVILFKSEPYSCQVCEIKNISLERNMELSSFLDTFYNCSFLSKCGRDEFLNIENLLKNVSFRHQQNVPFRSRKREKRLRFMKHNKPFLIKKESDAENMKNEISILERRKDSATSTSYEVSTVFPQNRVRREATKPMYEFNATAYRILVEQQALKRRLRRESEWAYLCVVFIVVLILFSIWIMRGFHSRTAKKRELRHDDTDHYLTVKEVLYRRARYLPMFNREGDFEEVFVHDCGTNP